MTDSTKQIFEIRDNCPQSLENISNLFEIIEQSEVLGWTDGGLVFFEYPSNYINMFPKWNGTPDEWLAFYFKSNEKINNHYLVNTKKNKILRKFIYCESQSDIKNILEIAIDRYKIAIQKGANNPEKWYNENPNHNNMFKIRPYAYEFNKELEEEERIPYEWIHQGINDLEIISVSIYPPRIGVELLYQFIRNSFPEDSKFSIDDVIKNIGYDKNQLYNKEDWGTGTPSELFNKLHNYYLEILEKNGDWFKCKNCNQYKHRSAFSYTEQSNGLSVCVVCSS